jgi:hypothetical protein
MGTGIMKQIPPAVIGFSLLFCGCTILGQPSVVSLKRADLPKGSAPERLRVDSVTAAANAGVNLTVATYNVGRFGSTDLKVIRQSLEEEFERISGKQEPNYSVTLIFTRYVQAFSNSHIALGAVVDYAVRGEGRFLLKDRFYAARNKGMGITPFGMVKDEFNRRILDRIVADTLVVVSGRLPRRESEATFNDLQSVLAVLPERVYGMGPVSPVIHLDPHPGIQIPWKDLLDVPQIDWK